jgi:hypothetical protein
MFCSTYTPPFTEHFSIGHCQLRFYLSLYFERLSMLEYTHAAKLSAPFIEWAELISCSRHHSGPAEQFSLCFNIARI